MYHGNHLAEQLRAASVGRDGAPFSTNAETGTTLTYGAFFANGERMAAALLRLGVMPGDRIAVQAPKTVEMLELYIGCVLAGAVFLPLNPAYTGREVSYFLGNATPVLFICDPDRQAELQPIAKGCGVRQVLTLRADGSGSLRKSRDTEAPGVQPMPRSANDIAAILYTSGTTGRSKGAMLSHRALASNAETLRDYWQVTVDDALIHALPIFHTHGLFVATNTMLMAGGKMIFMPAFEARTVRGAMANATMLMGVPTFYTRLLQLDGLAEAAAGMRLFISGSAPLMANTHDQWKDATGHAILERYGMTETNMNTSNPYEGERRAGTVGFALPGVELRVCDADGVDLPQGETGVIEVRGPNVFSGYWQMPEKTAEELRESGFFITGDLGRVDEDGYVEIVGRTKDLIITGGFNVYPKEVEDVIDNLHGVIESAVIGVPHPDFGEGVVAIAVGDAKSKVTEAEIATACASKLAKFKQPKAIYLVDNLPRNTMGKVQKSEIRKAYASIFM